MALYYIGNSRSAEQRREMQHLEDNCVCIFCQEHLDTDPHRTVLYRSAWWRVTPNQYPYKGASLHLLLVPAQHVADLLDLSEGARADFWLALDWVKDRYGLSYYGLGARCGDCRYTGGTVQHLHIHLIVGDPSGPEYTPVRLKLSSRPSDIP